MKELKNILGVAISNITTILSGIFVGFLIPKVLSVEGYGLYKTFTLYVGYLGIFSLGIVDGIYLKYGAKDYSELNRPLFRAYFRWFLIIHFIFAILAMGSAYAFVNNSNMQFILVFLGLNMIAVNVTGYFQHISQITQRFKEYSIRKILQSVLNIIAVAVLFIAYLNGADIQYRLYVILIVAINYALMFWYIITYKELAWGVTCKDFSVKKDLSPLIIKGFPLMFANLCSTLLLNIDRQFVNVLFETEQYAIYAFAYNMLSLVTVATSAVSTVLYPMLKRKDNEKSLEMYPQLTAAVLIMVYCIIIAYFPLYLIINWFLPKYSDSLEIFRIILPGIAISSVVTVIMHNYYKVMDKVLSYFQKSIIVLLVSAAANFIAYKIVGTMESISIASIITMIMWYVYVESYLFPFAKKDSWKNRFYAISMMVSFYISSALNSTLFGLLLYALLFVIVSFAFYRELLFSWRKAIFNKDTR